MLQIKTYLGISKHQLAEQLFQVVQLFPDVNKQHVVCSSIPWDRRTKLILTPSVYTVGTSLFPIFYYTHFSSRKR